MDSLQEIAISASPSKVYEAWTTKEGLQGWWSANVSSADGKTYVLGFDGGKVEFHFRVDEQVAGERVLWTGVAATKMPAEWVGTHIDVRITKTPDERTRMQFGHRDWRSAEGFYCVCNTTWGELVYRLKDWCEGKSRGPLFT